ncbi:MAG: DUF6882 domain-containing protein [Azonexus sp.]
MRLNLSSLPDSLSDDAFAEFQASCHRDLLSKQNHFKQHIAGASQWFYDMPSRRLEIGDSLFGMTPIGTYSSAYGSWLWAWANDDFPPEARALAAEIQTLHDTTGFRVFLEPGISAVEKDVDDFVALAVHALGADGFFRCNSNETSLYLAVHYLAS